jgi:pteridine reductase
MKSVLITGGAKRLGQALAEHYAAMGWQVFFTVRYSFEDGVELNKRLGPNTHCIRTAASSRTDAAMIKNWISTLTDGLDLLICSASTYKRISVINTTPSDFDNLLQSNLIGPFFLAQQLYDLLKVRGGNIVNIADSQTESGLPEFSAYLAAKAALVSITKSIAVEWAPDIRVNAVMPGSMPWPSDTFTDAEQLDMELKIPLLRVGEWNDVVEATQFLNDSKYITGTCLKVDGGRSIIY